MALSTCRDCAREVSTLARHCVHCGRPRPAGTPPGSVIAGIVAVLIALGITGAVVVAAKRACKKMHDRAGIERCDDRSIRCGKGLFDARDMEHAPVPEPKAEQY